MSLLERNRIGTAVDGLDGDPEIFTCLAAEVDIRHSDSVTEIVVGAGGVNVGSSVTSPGTQSLAAVFCCVSDSIRAAVNLSRAIAGSTGRPGDGPGIRVALCTGESTNGASWFAGTSLGVAKELLRQTRPDQILATVSFAVMAGRTLPSDTELLDRGCLTLGSGRTPERIYELRIDRRQGGNRTHVAASNLDWARRALDGPVLGFDEEVTALLKAWQAAVYGDGRVVLLAGEPGKSAVAAELALRVHAEGALVLYGRWDRDVVSPYQAVREALGVYADGCSNGGLRADLEGWGDAIARLLPDVGARVGGARPGFSTANHERGRLFAAVEAWLRALVSRRPTLLVLDDLHWADQASVYLLDHLRHSLAGLPLLIVVTASEYETFATKLLGSLDSFVDHADAGEFDWIRLAAS